MRTPSPSQQRTRARTYVTVIQSPEGYPSDSELRTLEETPASPVVHAVVLLDDHEKLEAENERLSQAAIELLLHPRSAKAALGMYDALGLNPFTIRDAAAKSGTDPS